MKPSGILNIIHLQKKHLSLTVVSKIFPISGDGIIGDKFLIDNHAIINVANNTITINECKIENDNNICFTVENVEFLIV